MTDICPVRNSEICLSCLEVRLPLLQVSKVCRAVCDNLCLRCFNLSAGQGSIPESVTETPPLSSTQSGATVVLQPLSTWHVPWLAHTQQGEALHDIQGLPSAANLWEHHQDIVSPLAEY